MANKPDLVTETQLNKETATDVKVVVKRKVTYVFIAKSSTNLSIPYVVIINGSVPTKFQSKPKRVSGEHGKIVIDNLNVGDKIALYLNSDAHADYRTNQVYEVTVKEKDIMVTITEKKGKHTAADTPTQVIDKDTDKETKKLEDTYEALLTGDIWMKVSHKYASDEVDKLVPTDTSAEVISGLKQIYDVLSKAELKITLPAKDKVKERTLTVKFADSNNPNDNISTYSLLDDGLTRVHPSGYAALFNAAFENNIPTLTLTSCWRPMLGSIAHRAGLGLDVNMVGGTHVNRTELRNSLLPATKKDKKGKAISVPATNEGNHNDDDNVTDDEVRLFKLYEDAIVANKTATAELKSAEAAAKLAAKNKKLSVEERSKVIESVTVAKKRSDDAKSIQKSAEEAWDSERNRHEPDNVKLYRTSLLKCDCVKQLFDPWFMDNDTHDKLTPEPNMQRGASTSNERLHAHHLHVTVFEPKIL